MKVLVSRRSFLLRLDICLVLCGCLALFGWPECGARVVAKDNSGTRIEEVHEDLSKSTVVEPSHINDELQSDDEVDYVTNEKRLRRITETSGKFDKGNDDKRVEGIAHSRAPEIDKNIRNDKLEQKNLKELHEKQISNEQQKEVKKLIKRSIARLKRSNQNANDETTQIPESSGKFVENKNSEATDYLTQHPRVNVEGIRRLDVDIEEEDKKENHELAKINIRTTISEDVDKSAEITSKIANVSSKSTKNKLAEASDHTKQNEGVSSEGIRRLASNAEVVDEISNHELLKVNVRTTISEGISKPAEINSKVVDNVQSIDKKDIEYGRSQEFKSETRITDDKSRAELSKEPEIAEKSSNKNINHTSVHINRSTVLSDTNLNDKLSEEIQSRSKEVRNKDKNVKAASSRAETLSKLQYLKAQALELQVKIRNSTFLQHLKKQMTEILPDIPKFTENQYLDILRTILSKKNKHQSMDVDSFKENELSDKQIEIIRCAQQLVAQKERQSFFDNISECIRGLNVLNCMRIFIYPLIVENMPEALIQGLPNFPIEINIPDLLQGNRDRPKSARQVPIISLYSNPVDPDTILYNILMEGLLKNPSNENLPSFIHAKNESLSKYLTCNRFHLLQMTEKFLPENARQGYSDEMLSCVTRFEYFSCIKYFSWPVIKQYYTELPQFPLSDSYLSSLIYPHYPLITFPGFENGFGILPEVIESGPARVKPETIFMHIFKKALKEYPRVATLPTPIQLDLIVKSHFITQEQIATIHLAEQLLPVNIRAEYVSKTVQCIRQYDYYSCMKYVTWPIVRQSVPSLSGFPNIQDIINNFQLSDIPQLTNLVNYFSQFQLPQFQIPQLQLPDVSTFTLPDFSTFFPFGQQTSTPSTVETPNSDTAPEGNNKINTGLESKIYKILKNVRDSLGATPLSAPTYTNRKVFLFPLMTEEQSKIFALAEGILPPIAREPLITSIYFCLNEKNEFSTCTKTIIWPFIKSYVKGLPEFPMEDHNFLAEQKVDINIPITGIGDNFFIMREIEKFFFEGREDAMSYIIRLIQLYKSESLNMQKILEILRSIQFNTPEFLNMQTIQYPRDSEFSTVLTECQENIVHAVENIIPEHLRQKFYHDMLDCSKKNKFPICSRNIIFPSIYQYFQKALSVPYYNITPEKKHFSKATVTEASRIHPVRIETKVNTEKQGENIVTTTDRKFIPIFPSNPELVIFGMLRKAQISAAHLPDFPKETIANTLEFKQAFSARQAHILIVAEGILPEEYRKGILEEMYKCNQRDSFLNCTRAIIFPAMSKAYPDFPAFPDFERDLSQSNMISIIENLNKTSSSQRSYDSKRTLPFIEILYKFVPEDRSDILRTLVDKLPDSLYYDLYIKMTQCTQFSDVISCGHDIIYPTLKQYYHAPKFNLDNYYPISVQPPYYSAMVDQHSSFDYEIICENMGFICTLKYLEPHYEDGTFKVNRSPVNYEAYLPFGKLSDGSRIFKHTQDIWNSNITPSVGADKSSIYEYTNQPAATNIDFGRKSLYSSQFQKPNALKLKKSDINFLIRIKRNVDDLLDSYPHSVPDIKKNSVPRRIPPKLTFPNITEVELLQILVNVSESKNERTSINEDITTGKDTADFLNNTERSSITMNQYEILKLVQRLNSETAKAGFMSRLVQCIRSLSFLRCIGIFVWPMISSNLPSLPFISSVTRDTRALAEELQIKELFGVTTSEFETELMNRKHQIESNFIQWYKALTEEKFEMDIGLMKIKGDGNGELSIIFSSFREGRMSKLKDNKNLPSILTIISEVIEDFFDTKINKTKSKKENLRKLKRDRSLHDFENYFRNFYEQEDIKKSVKDDQIINILLEKLRPTVTNIEDDNIRHYFTLEDAYIAFEVLFGPKVIDRIANQLESIGTGDITNFEKNFEESKAIDELKLEILEVQKKNVIEKLNDSFPKRMIHEFESENLRSSSYGKQLISQEKLTKLKAYIAEYVKKYLNISKRKTQTEFAVQLPRLKDNITGRKITDLNDIGRGLKTKMTQIMPAAGLAISFLVQLVLSHAKAAASVAGLISNMALGSAIFGMIRDLVFGSNNQPKIKYIYDTDKYGTGISWPSVSSNSYTPTNRIHEPSPLFDEPY